MSTAPGRAGQRDVVAGVDRPRRAPCRCGRRAGAARSASAASSTSSARWWSRRCAAAAADDGDAASRRPPARSRARARGRSRPWSTGWRSMRTPAASAALTACGARRIEVADEHVDAQPERRGVLEARVGRDHERAGRAAARPRRRPEPGRRSRRGRARMLPPATPRGECARIAACAWSRWEICCSTWSCGSRRRPRRDDDVPAAIALVPGGQAANVAAWVCWLGGRGAPDRAQGRRRGGPRGRGRDGAPRRGAGGAGGRAASARAPSSRSSRPTGRARSRAIAAPRASSARTTSTRACWPAPTCCTSPATRSCASRAPRRRCGWRRRPGATVLA